MNEIPAAEPGFFYLLLSEERPDHQLSLFTAMVSVVSVPNPASFSQLPLRYRLGVLL